MSDPADGRDGSAREATPPPRRWLPSEPEPTQASTVSNELSSVWYPPADDASPAQGPPTGSFPPPPSTPADPSRWLPVEPPVSEADTAEPSDVTPVETGQPAAEGSAAEPEVTGPKPRRFRSKRSKRAVPDAVEPAASTSVGVEPELSQPEDDEPTVVAPATTFEVPATTPVAEDPGVEGQTEPGAESEAPAPIAESDPMFAVEPDPAPVFDPDPPFAAEGEAEPVAASAPPAWSSGLAPPPEPNIPETASWSVADPDASPFTPPGDGVIGSPAPGAEESDVKAPPPLALVVEPPAAVGEPESAVWPEPDPTGEAESDPAGEAQPEVVPPGTLFEVPSETAEPELPAPATVFEVPSSGVESDMAPVVPLSTVPEPTDQSEPDDATPQLTPAPAPSEPTPTPSENVTETTLIPEPAPSEQAASTVAQHPEYLLAGALVVGALTARIVKNLAE